MSYCRFGWESSDAYIFGTIKANKPCIECCACRLTGTYASATFYTYGDLLRHINEHRAAGHHILDQVEERVRREIDDPDERFIEVGVLPTAMHPDPGPQREEDEVFKRARALMEEL